MDGPLSVTSMIEQDRRISEIVAGERSRLRNFIRRRVPDPSDAEDIVQEVFYELVESQSPADAHRARDRLAFSRRAQSHHGPFPQEEAGALQRRSSRGRRRRTAADRRSVAIARCRAGSAVLPQRASG